MPDLTPDSPNNSQADSRVRRYIMPVRIVWRSDGGVSSPENLLIRNADVCVLARGEGREPPGILLDFGMELHGGVRLEAPTTSTGRAARVRVRFGESVSEAMGDPNNDHTIHDFEAFVAWMGSTEIGCTGFRFARIDLLDTETSLTLEQVRAVFLFRDIPYLGSFESSDDRLNEIWKTGAHTVHMCMQEHVWDGIKRDRLVWIGDLHPEAMVISAVFGENEIVPASLDYVRDKTPLPGWMNGISSYSLWWIIIQYDWYRYHGNWDYLREQSGYLIGLLDHVMSRQEADGRERLDGFRFLEWPTSGDPTAIDVGLQALTMLALTLGSRLCEYLGEASAARRALGAAARAASCARPATESKQANALAVLAGTAAAIETNERILARDPYRGLSTFYGYYVLQARAEAGDHAGCLDLIRNYWGGMLDAGATTFWEGFEIDWIENSSRIDELPRPGRRDIHADFGDWCYKGLRHSLCHGWAAGPTAWLMEHILGITPAFPGFGQVELRPHLAGLSYARGTFPTPHGLIEVTHEMRPDGEIETDLKLPDGVQIVRTITR